MRAAGRWRRTPTLPLAVVTFLCLGGLVTSSTLGAFPGKAADGPLADSRVMTANSVLPAPATSPGWQLLRPSSSPPPMPDAATAYDARDRCLLLFGLGVRVTPGGGWRAIDLPQTWIYANGAWTNLTAQQSVSPSPRQYAMMAYDAKDGFVLLFGGQPYNSLADANDTWAFYEGHWHELNPGASPPARDSGSLAYDVLDGYVVLFGGWEAGGLLGDTWKFAGGRWTPLTAGLSLSPPARVYGSLAYDPTDAALVLFGGGVAQITPQGLGPRFTLTNDTWIFQSGHWRLSTGSSIGPPARFGGTMTSTPVGALLIGGATSTLQPLMNDTWVYSDGQWHVLTLNLTGLAYEGEFGSVAFDPTGDQAIEFGGDASPASGNPRGCGPSTPQCPVGPENWTLALPFPVPQGSTAWESVPHLFAELSWSYNARAGTDTVWLNGTAAGGEAPYALAALDAFAPTVNQINDHIVLCSPPPATNSSPDGLTCIPGSGWSGAPGTAEVIDNVPPASVVYFEGLLVDNLGQQSDAQSVAVVTASSYHASPPLHILNLSATVHETLWGPTVSFDSAVWGGVPPVRVHWSFGDGGQTVVAAGQSVSYAYALPGTYRPAAIAVDAAGHSYAASLSPVVVGSPNFGVPSLFVPLLVVAAVAGVALWTRRARLRRERREAEALLRTLQDPPVEADVAAAEK